ncbi:hypothetical protein D3C87_324040 [compost metagenome]
MTDTTKEKGKAGRPLGSTRKTSQLKPVFNQLKKMSPEALANIQKSVSGAVVDKDVLSSSKWVVNTLTTVHKAVISEEEGLKIKDDETTPDEVVEKPSNFSLSRIK